MKTLLALVMLSPLLMGAAFGSGAFGAGGGGGGVTPVGPFTDNCVIRASGTAQIECSDVIVDDVGGMSNIQVGVGAVVQNFNIVGPDNDSTAYVDSGLYTDGIACLITASYGGGLVGQTCYYGDANSGTFLGTTLTNVTVMQGSATPLLVGTTGSHAMVLGTNNTARLTFGATGTATFATNIAASADNSLSIGASGTEFSTLWAQTLDDGDGTIDIDAQLDVEGQVAIGVAPSSNYRMRISQAAQGSGRGLFLTDGTASMELYAGFTTAVIDMHHAFVVGHTSTSINQGGTFAANREVLINSLNGGTLGSIAMAIGGTRFLEMENAGTLRNPNTYTCGGIASFGGLCVNDPLKLTGDISSSLSSVEALSIWSEANASGERGVVAGTADTTTSTIPFSVALNADAASASRTYLFQVDGTGTSTSFDGHIVNENGTSTGDFRAESDANTHMLFVDASANMVGINDSSPNKTLDITLNGSAADGVAIRAANTTWGPEFWIMGSTDNLFGRFCAAVGTGIGNCTYDSVAGDVFMQATDVSNRMILGAGQDFSNGVGRLWVTPTEVVINENSRADTDLRWESDSTANAFFCDASANTCAFNVPVTLAGGSGAAGSTTEVQYNLSGTMTGASGLTYDAASGVVINEAGGTAIDFRVETDSADHAFFCDASANTCEFAVSLTAADTTMTILTVDDVDLSGRLAASPHALGTCDGSDGPLLQGYAKDASTTSLCACEELAGVWAWRAVTATGDCT